MKINKRLLSLMLSVTILFGGITPVLAVEENATIHEDSALQEALNSARKQLILQEAEDLFPVFEEVIREEFKQMTDSEINLTSSDEKIAYSYGSGVIGYTTYDKYVTMTKAYLSINHAKKVYESIIDEEPSDYIFDELFSIILEFTGPFYGLAKAPFKFSVQYPLKDLVAKKRPALIITAVDHTDADRVNYVTVEWRNSPYMSYPSNARNLEIENNLKL